MYERRANLFFLKFFFFFFFTDFLGKGFSIAHCKPPPPQHTTPYENKLLQISVQETFGYTQLSSQLLCMPVLKSTTFFYILYAIIYYLVINLVMSYTLVYAAVFSSPSVLPDLIYNNVTICRKHKI